MGCSASKGLSTVEPIQTSNKVIPIITNEQTRRVSSPKHTQPDVESEADSTGNLNNMQQTSNGLAFEIDFDNDGESIIRKHPPKRFQRLEEQQQQQHLTPARSLDRLQEKLDEAQVRRQQFLMQRVTSSKQQKILQKQSSIYSIDEQHFDKQQQDDFSKIIQDPLY